MNREMNERNHAEKVMIHEVMNMAYREGIKKGEELYGGDSMKWLQRKVESQRRELARLNDAHGIEKIKYESYHTGYRDGLRDGENQCHHRREITITAAYQEGVRDGRKQAIEAMKEKTGGQ